MQSAHPTVEVAHPAVEVAHRCAEAVPSSIGRDRQRGELGAEASPIRVALLDRRGIILAVNTAWARFAAENGAGDAADPVGSSYLDACADAACGLPDTADAARVLRDVFEGCDSERRLAYACRGRNDERRFLVQVIASGEGEARRIVAVHTDLTEVNRATRDLQDLAARKCAAQDEERRHVARELHDGTAPTLVALSLDLARLAASTAGPAHELVSSCAALCEQAIQELRTLTFLLHPPALERVGLAAALESLAAGFGRRTGIDVTVSTSAASPLSSEVELALYRIAQEGLANVHRHSTSRTARIRLVTSARETTLTVEDDGPAPAGAPAPRDGVGLASMKERAAALGGRLTLTRGPLGTTLAAVVPRPPRRAAPGRAPRRARTPVR